MRIIAIHGNGQDHRIFAPLNNIDLYCIDLPGHNHRPSMEKHSIENYSKFVQAKVSELNDEDCVLLGHSLGGHISLDVALHCSNIVGLISIGAPPLSTDTMAHVFKPNPTIACVYKENPSDEELIAFIQEGSVNREYDELLLEMFHNQSAQARTSLFSSLQGGVSDELLKINQLTIPSLFVYGENERLINVDYIRSLDLDGYKTLSGGHNIMLDNPTDLELLISKFIESLKD